MIVIPRWASALVLYLLIVLVIIAARPALMFDADGNPKPFGTGFADGYSVFAPSFIFPVLGVLMFLFSGVFAFAVSA